MGRCVLVVTLTAGEQPSNPGAAVLVPPADAASLITAGVAMRRSWPGQPPCQPQGPVLGSVGGWGEPQSAGSGLPPAGSHRTASFQATPPDPQRSPGPRACSPPSLREVCGFLSSRCRSLLRALELERPLEAQRGVGGSPSVPRHTPAPSSIHRGAALGSRGGGTSIWCVRAWEETQAGLWDVTSQVSKAIFLKQTLSPHPCLRRSPHGGEKQLGGSAACPPPPAACPPAACPPGRVPQPGSAWPWPLGAAGLCKAKDLAASRRLSRAVF